MEALFLRQLGATFAQGGRGEAEKLLRREDVFSCFGKGSRGKRGLRICVRTYFGKSHMSVKTNERRLS